MPASAMQLGQRRLPHALGQPHALAARTPKCASQIVGHHRDLPARVALRQHRQHRLVEAAAEELDLAAPDERAQLVEVVGAVAARSTRAAGRCGAARTFTVGQLGERVDQRAIAVVVGLLRRRAPKLPSGWWLWMARRRVSWPIGLGIYAPKGFSATTIRSGEEGVDDERAARRTRQAARAQERRVLGGRDEVGDNGAPAGLGHADDLGERSLALGARAMLCRHRFDTTTSTLPSGERERARVLVADFAVGRRRLRRRRWRGCARARCRSNADGDTAQAQPHNHARRIDAVVDARGRGHRRG